MEGLSKVHRGKAGSEGLSKVHQSGGRCGRFKQCSPGKSQGWQFEAKLTTVEVRVAG